MLKSPQGPSPPLAHEGAEEGSRVTSQAGLDDHRGHRLLPAVSAGLAAAAIVLAALGLRGGHDVVVGPNVLLTGRGATAIIDANNSPTIAANPQQPINLVAVNRVDRPGYSAVLHWSFDSGTTWSDTALPLPAGRDRAYAPDIAFDPQGILYVLYVNLEGKGNDPQTVWLARSHDGGRTLEAPVAVAGRLSFQARLAVDGHGRVYVTWIQATAVGNLTIVGAAPVVAATSEDGGSTFAAPVRVSDPARERVGVPVPVVDSEGNLEVLYEDFKNDVRDFQNLSGPPWPAPFSLVVSRSTTHGKAFSPGVEVDTGLLAGARFLVYLPPYPSLAAAADGSLYAAWSDARSGADAVFIRRSTDGGESWGPGVMVPGAPAGAVAILPRVSVAPDGRVDVAFLAGQVTAGDGLVDAYLATSDDGGNSFRSVRVSSTSFDSRIGPLTGPSYLGPDLGSKLGGHSTDASAVVAWVDTRKGTLDTGRQDVAMARVDMPKTGVSAGRLAISVALLLLSAIAAVPVLRGAVALRGGRRGRS